VRRLARALGCAKISVRLFLRARRWRTGCVPRTIPARIITSRFERDGLIVVETSLVTTVETIARHSLVLPPIASPAPIRFSYTCGADFGARTFAGIFPVARESDPRITSF